MSVVSLEELKPDFVLSIQNNGDEELLRLLDFLKANYFLTQIRSGKGLSKFLFFIRLKKHKFDEILKENKVNDFLCDINNDILLEEFDETSDSERLRIVYEYLVSTIKILKKNSIVESIQPINFDKDDELLKSMMKVNLGENEIMKLESKFGSKVAFYFSFLKTYLNWLLFPATIGLLNFSVFGNTKYSNVYSVILIVWSILFFHCWTKKQANYSNLWRINNTIVNNNTASVIAKKLMFIPIASMFIVVLVIYQLFCFSVEMFINELYVGPLKPVLALLPTVMLSGFVPILSIVYKKINFILTMNEKNKYKYDFDNSLNEKNFVLTFLTSYLALFITCYIYFPFGYLMNDYTNTIVSLIKMKFHSKFPVKLNHFIVIDPKRIQAQFFFSIVTNQVISIGVDYILPFALNFVLKFMNKEKVEYKDDESESKYLASVRKQVYEYSEIDFNANFSSMIIQIGYLLLFSQIWTISPLICVFFNYIKLFGDLIKLFKFSKMAIPVRDNTIHPWDLFLKFIIWTSTLLAPLLNLLYNKSDIILGKRSFSEETKALFEGKLGTGLSSKLNFWTVIGCIMLSEHLFIVLNYIASLFFNKVHLGGSKKVKEDIVNRIINKSFVASAVNAAAAIQKVKKDNESIVSMVENKWIESCSDDVDNLVNEIREMPNKVKFLNLKANKMTSAPAKPATDDFKPPKETGSSLNNDKEKLTNNLGTTGISVHSEALEKVGELNQRRSTTASKILEKTSS